MMIKHIAIATALLSALSVSAQKNTAYPLSFNVRDYETQTLSYKGKEFKVRAFEKIVYVAHPVDTAYQVMNIYIPEAYFKGQSINGYTDATAPIFFPNQVGGYMPAKPAYTKGRDFLPPINGELKPGNDKQLPPRGAGGPAGPLKRENTVVAALSRGYIVASAGARGRTNQDANGKYQGKAPAAIVDLKAAVRYLKYNDKIMPGDAGKIISNGTSAGGAMSALLGATGDNPDYLPYLRALGAADASDAIFASSDYCPITNLDHADAAYEWQFYGVNSYVKGFGAPAGAATGTLSDIQIKVSADLRQQFPVYVNSLNLTDDKGNRLTLDAQGNGSFKDYVKSVVIASANKALKEGTDLSQKAFLTIQGGTVADLDWDAYVTYMQRQKTPPAFDAMDLSAPENSEFGTESTNAMHFTGYSLENSAVKNSAMANSAIIKMMNPMNYIGVSNTKTARYWRIRHGSKDKDTGLGISAILAVYLSNHGYRVDYALPWDKPHSGDYDLDELFTWVDSITK